MIKVCSNCGGLFCTPPDTSFAGKSCSCGYADTINLSLSSLRQERDQLAARVKELENQLASADCLGQDYLVQAGELKTDNLKQNQRILELEMACGRMKDDLDKLARLGNEPHFGNSIANTMAQEALQTPTPTFLQMKEIAVALESVANKSGHYGVSFQVRNALSTARQLGLL